MFVVHMAMEHRIFKLNEGRFLERCPQVELSAIDSVGDDDVWIDISRRDPDALSAFLTSMKLHPLAVDACLEVAPNSRIVAYGQSLFIGLLTQTTWDEVERVFLSVVCLPGMIITIHEAQIPALENIVTQFTSSMRFHSLSTSAILYQILDHIIDQDMAFALGARNRIDCFEELFEQKSDSDLAGETLSIKRQVALLEAMFEDQLHCVSSLQTIESDSFSIEGLQDYFRDAITHLEHAVRSVGRQADHLAAIHQNHLLKLQDKANKRLQILTVISAIFLPMMLVTGIYGMNFRHMPELTWRYGYFGVLLAMTLVASVMLWLFYSKGWFK